MRRSEVIWLCAIMQAVTLIAFFILLGSKSIDISTLQGELVNTHSALCHALMAKATASDTIRVVRLQPDCIEALRWQTQPVVEKQKADTPIIIRHKAPVRHKSTDSIVHLDTMRKINEKS